MELFRSQPMQYVSLTVSVDAAADVMREVGKMAKFHIVDLNEHVSAPTDFYLFHKKRVVAASYWERKLKRFEDVMTEFEIPLPPIDAPREAGLDGKGDVLADVKNYVEPLELELNRNIEYRSAETRKMNELYERAIVLEVSKAHLFSGEMAAIPQGDVARFRNARAEISKSGTSELLEEDKKAQQAEEGTGRFHNYVCGVMPVLQQAQFDRMLFRISRGNAYARYAAVEEDIRDPATNEPMKKTVFYVAFVGSQVGRRVEKMCDYFRATRYDVPNTPEAFDAELLQIGVQIQEKRAVVDRTTEQIVSLLQKVAWDSVEKHFSPLRNWEDLLHRERLISDALKKTVVPNGSRILRCEGWCPVDEISNFNNALHEAVSQTGAQAPIVQFPLVKQRPPTYFKLNKFTASFQGIVDTYGVPRYQEVNPGLFTIVTFPFLFGIMYGDIGHGCLLFCFALMMVLKEQEFLQKIKNKTMPELLGMAFGGRYLLLGMSICAIYCGIIYNDFMSIPLNVYGSAWKWNGTAITANAPTKVYPIGIDPGWFHTKNELAFFNSLKMKVSVTFGVVQMCFGIVLGLFNHLYFKNYVSIYCEFVPQLLFMLCTFGYMIIMILIKFSIDWENSPGRSAPNLIQTMIAMFLSPGSVKAEEQLFAGQAGFQAFLVVVALICVPWMLFPKPYIERHHHNQRKLVSNRKPVGPAFEAEDTLELDEKKTSAHGHSHGGAHGHAHGGEAAADGGHGHDDEEEFNFSEHMIHQAIHTIEFILGAVSNTASYLRLWALSLAHEQLAKVFWSKMIVDYGIGSGSFIMGVIGFGAWAFATLGVLLAMDVLECFLHALRLHWVEFQSKFFQADGYAFAPFDFAVQEDSN